MATAQLSRPNVAVVAEGGEDAHDQQQDSATLVIFGITGDLSCKKLIPAVYEMAVKEQLPPDFDLVGFSRRPASLHEKLKASLMDYAGDRFDPAVWARLSDRLHCVQGSYDDPHAYRTLARLLDQLRRSNGTAGNCLFYLSVPPSAFTDVSSGLEASGLSKSQRGWRRVMVEKPLGYDLASARAISEVLERAFHPTSIFRIDHYLGKEAVQNILALRFSNRLFEASWTGAHIDHVQITMAETVGVTGRAGYYDGVGAARDVIQNHLLQLLALVAMEEPASFDAVALGAAKHAVLEATRISEPFGHTTARGQYGAGISAGAPVPGLTEEAAFAADSVTETYAALTVSVDTPRWAGVPFYLRTGKRLSAQTVEIAVTFRSSELGSDEAVANVLVLRLQPQNLIELQIGTKAQGRGLRVRPVNMEFDLRTPSDPAPDAYERLIRDAIRGDAALFPTRAEVERSWEIVDPVIEYWARDGFPEVYPAGSDGPVAARVMLARDGRQWRPL